MNRSTSKGESVTFIDTGSLTEKEIREGWRGRFFHSQEMTFAYYSVEAGASIHEHSHPNDEVWHVIEGQIAITVAGETHIAGPGCAVVVPPDAPHSVRVLASTRAIVVDHPRRESIGGITL